MAFKGNFVFDFFDVRGNRLDDRLDVHLRHTVLSGETSKMDFDGKKALKIQDLESTPDGRFATQILPMHYRPVGRFLQVLEDKTVRHAFTFPADPKRVSQVRFPDFNQLPESLRQVLDDSRIEGLEDFQGGELYGALKQDRLQAAGLLNIHAKMRAVKFNGGRSVADFLTALTRVRGDRFFAKVQKELRDAVVNSLGANLFQRVDGSLHTPPPGFVAIDSFKTLDHYGNLQLTFSNNPATLEFRIDADLDDAQGIEHVFQVLSHALTGGETHPYDIHEILLAHQGIDPGYELVV